jgi:putative SOS response-associated peptidase YedK
MCNFKSEVEKYNELMAHYSASFESITAEMELIREKFSVMIAKDSALKSIGMGNPDQLGAQLMAYNEKDALPSTLTKQELTEMRWYQRFLSAYENPETYQRFYENGFDHFPTHVITAGEPGIFKFFRWGLVPFFTKTEADANKGRINTLNCISEEMWEKPSFRDAIKNGQRCLIPVTGFYEWRWLDEAGTVKIPYYVTFRDGKPRSIGGLYSRWKNPATGEYLYTYTVLTCPANTIMEYVHNAKKRMPVFIDPRDEKAWLNKDLSKDDVNDLCKPYQDPAMRAYTISKLLTTRNVNINVPEVRAPFNYNNAIHQINDLLAHGDKKKAIETFKASIAESGKEQQMRIAAGQEILPELSMA